MECKATTKSGTQCTRLAEPGSKYCWQHQNYDKNDVKNLPVTLRERSFPSDEYKALYCKTCGTAIPYNKELKKILCKNCKQNGNFGVGTIPNSFNSVTQILPKLVPKVASPRNSPNTGARSVFPPSVNTLTYTSPRAS